MTQSCDLANDKTEQILLCALNPASYYSSNLDNIRKNKMPALCLIDEFILEDSGEENLEMQVVDFRAVYSLPKKYILDLTESKSRARLLPPYREYLSQSFCTFLYESWLAKRYSIEKIIRLNTLLDFHYYFPYPTL